MFRANSHAYAGCRLKAMQNSGEKRAAFYPTACCENPCRWNNDTTWMHDRLSVQIIGLQNMGEGAQQKTAAARVWHPVALVPSVKPREKFSTGLRVLAGAGVCNSIQRKQRRSVQIGFTHRFCPDQIDQLTGQRVILLAHVHLHAGFCASLYSTGTRRYKGQRQVRSDSDSTFI